MKMNRIGQSDLVVSELCLGTMTFGTQTDAAESHAQIDFAHEAGINFMDAAEMYPVNPIRKETVGKTEEIIGDWFAATGRRNDWVLATKHSGEGFPHARGGAPISSKTVREAVEGSLKRLKTDVIDLYQLHWPNRGSMMFRKNWSFAPWDSGWSRQQVIDNIEDVLGALQAEVDRGTIRAVGLSNEGAWGTSQWLAAAQRVGGPRMESLQNEYSLMCRMADTDLAELMTYEQVSLLPYSPLATGLLTGKYQGGAVPEGSRMAINGDLGGRRSDNAFVAVDAYLEVAKRFDLDPALMALNWSARRPFVASSIFGATTLDQLKHLVKAVDFDLPDEAWTALDQVNRAHPMPY
jgi:aryl-alcohol dehydrogenase-like predicted oxidoreductase